jgi:hypothetical protein
MKDEKEIIQRERHAFIPHPSSFIPSYLASLTLAMICLKLG